MSRILVAALGLLTACAGSKSQSQAPDAGPRLPDSGASVRTSTLCINEFMAQNAFSLVHEGQRPDWIELRNVGEQDVDLVGYTITDNPALPNKHRFESSLIVPSGGLVLLYADSDPALGLDHLGFDLNKQGESIAVFDPDGNLAAAVAFGTQATDLSAVPSEGGWASERNPTPGADNTTNCQPQKDPNAASPIEVPAVVDPSTVIYDPEQILEFRIELSDEAMTALTLEPKVYVQGTFLFEGRRYGPVAVRLKGNDTLRPITGKPSFKVKFSEYVLGAEFMETKRLTLNNMITDPTMMKERLAYELFREAGVPAPRCNHVRVYLNGEYYGLYANVEAVKSRMIARWFQDATGPLFEGEGADFIMGDLHKFVLDDGPDDRTNLQGLAGDLALPPATAMGAAENHADVSQFVLFWSASMAVGHMDGYPNKEDDYNVYDDPTSGQLHFIPWGTDEAFSSANVTSADELMAVSCNADPACQAAWRSKVVQMLDLVDALGFPDKVDSIAAQISSHVAQDVKKEISTPNVALEQADLKDYILGRREHLLEDINAVP